MSLGLRNITLADSRLDKSDVSHELVPQKSHTIHFVLFIVVYEVERGKSFLAILAASSYCAPVGRSRCACRRGRVCQRGRIAALRQRPHRMKAAVAISTMLSGNRANSCRETWKVMAQVCSRTRQAAASSVSRG
jgi:hypothetical protein